MTIELYGQEVIGEDELHNKIVENVLLKTVEGTFSVFREGARIVGLTASQGRSVNPEEEPLIFQAIVPYSDDAKNLTRLVKYDGEMYQVLERYKARTSRKLSFRLRRLRDVDNN